MTIINKRKKKNNMKYALFYGSLKQNHYNFGRCGDQKYIKTLQLDGYDLYSLGAYPGIVPGTGKLTVELHEVDEKTLQNIRYMELGAGYEEKMIDIDGKPATLYIYKNKFNRLSEKSKIPSGNWEPKHSKW
jgi:gamma-glutamylcyclotransferase (GGCT)/AIG2-like uncharacterized protein YtfP